MSFEREPNQPDYPIDEGVGETYVTETTTTVGTGVPVGSYAGTTSSTGSGSQSTVDTVKDQGGQVAQSAKESTQQVAGVAADQAKTVASEAKSQAGNLLDEARSQLSSQVSTQQQNLAGWVRSIAEELSAMVDGAKSASDDGTPVQGSATTLVRQVSDRAHSAAGWLEQHEPSEVLDEVSRFARRRPGAFLALAALGGLLAGRLTRGLTAGNDSSDSSTSSYSGYSGVASPAPVVTSTTSYPAGPVSSEWAEPAGYPTTGVGAVEGGTWPTETGTLGEPGYLDQPGGTSGRDLR
jgi:hypothetical protein